MMFFLKGAGFCMGAAIVLNAAYFFMYIRDMHYLGTAFLFAAVFFLMKENKEQREFIRYITQEYKRLLEDKESAEGRP